jgi:hypothetical protein
MFLEDRGQRNSEAKQMKHYITCKLMEWGLGRACTSRVIGWIVKKDSEFACSNEQSHLQIRPIYTWDQPQEKQRPIGYTTTLQRSCTDKCFCIQLAQTPGNLRTNPHNTIVKPKSAKCKIPILPIVCQVQSHKQPKQLRFKRSQSQPRRQPVFDCPGQRQLQLQPMFHKVLAWRGCEWVLR